MAELAVVLGLLFLLLCVSIAALHSLRMRRLMLLDWAVLGIGGVYGGGWALVAFVTIEGGEASLDQWLLPFVDLYPIHTLGSLLLLASIWFGWMIFRFPYFSRGVGLHISIARTDRRLSMAMWTLLVIAFVMQWFYTRAYGGFLGLLEYSALIRSAIFVVDNPLSFLQPFGGLALFASFGFFGMWLAGQRHLGVGVGFALSFLFSLYLLFSWLGRIDFLIYVVTFILGLLLFRKPRPLVMLIGGGFTMIAVVVGAYYVSIWLDLKSADSLDIFLARELSFPFVSFFAQLDLGEHLFRAFSDFLVAPLYMLPSSWWSSWGVEDVSQINTAVIMGAPKGEQGVTGGVPVDLLTLGLMQASIAGIAVVGVAFGAMLRLTQSLLDKLQNAGVRAVFEAYAALKIAILGVYYSQPSLFLAGNFDFIVAAMIVALFLYSPRLRLNKKQLKKKYCDAPRVSTHSPACTWSQEL